MSTTLFLPLPTIHSNSNAISLLPWATITSRHPLHYLMKPLLHWAVPSHQRHQVLLWRNQSINPLWLRAHHTCSVIIWTNLFRNSKHIINLLLEKQVKVKVLCHQTLWIHLCCSIPMQVTIVPSRGQIWWNTWGVQLFNKPNLLQNKENFVILFFLV